MIAVRTAPPDHYSWIAERAKLALLPNFRAIEALDGERIVGMVGFDGWTPGSCMMHVAIEKPIAVRRLLRPAFGLVFDPRPRGFDFAVVTGSVLSTNEAALKLDLHLGFREVARIRDGWERGIDVVLLEMRRESCRWLGV